MIQKSTVNAHLRLGSIANAGTKNGKATTIRKVEKEKKTETIESFRVRVTSFILKQ